MSPGFGVEATVMRRSCHGSVALDPPGTGTTGAALTAAPIEDRLRGGATEDGTPESGARRRSRGSGGRERRGQPPAQSHRCGGREAASTALTIALLDERSWGWIGGALAEQVAAASSPQSRSRWRPSLIQRKKGGGAVSRERLLRRPWCRHAIWSRGGRRGGVEVVAETSEGGCAEGRPRAALVA